MQPAKTRARACQQGAEHDPHYEQRMQQEGRGRQRGIHFDTRLAHASVNLQQRGSLSVRHVLHAFCKSRIVLSPDKRAKNHSCRYGRVLRLRGAARQPVVARQTGHCCLAEQALGVCAASYEARSFGVHSAMPAIRAERLCPDAIFVPPDFPRYREVGVREIFKRHTDLIEPLSLDEAYLDVTENKTGLPTATLVARTTREQIRQELGLTASAGVAPNKFLAKLASDWRKPDGLFVIQPADIDGFLLALPVGRLPGVGKITGEKLANLGAQAVRDLRTLDLSVLEHHFGRYGQRLHELALGIDDSPVVPDRPTKISVEDTFERDVLLGH